MSSTFPIPLDIINILEGEIEQGEYFYKQIIQNLPGAFYICDAQGIIKFYNKTAADLWGRTPIIGQDMWCGSLKMFHPDGQPMALDVCPMAIALKEERPVYNAEIIVERPDGIRRNILPHPQPIFDAKGKLAGAFNILMDITERKNAEEEIKKKNKSLEILYNIGKTISSELELTKVVQSITDAATEISRAQFGAFFYNLLDEKGEYYTLYTISGVPREEFSKFPMPRKTSIFAPTFHGTDIVRSDDITKDPRYGKNAPFKGMPKGHLPVKSYLAVPVVSRTGEVIGGLFFGHSESGVFTQNSENHITAIASQAAIAMDNSKLYEASKNDKVKLAEINTILKKNNDDLQKINIDLDNFIYTASHDLKSPIANIEGLISALSRKLKNENTSKEELDALLQMMNHSITRFSKTIGDLTTITKIQKNIDEGSIEYIDLNDIIDEVKSTYPDLFSETDVDLIIDCENCPGIRFSRNNLKSIFYNLISNAIKYRSPFRNPQIIVSHELTDEYIILKVKDNGLGLNKMQQEKMFSMFKRFHSHVEGTGIGLYLVKRIITNAGGKVEVESELDVGTTFKMYFKH